MLFVCTETTESNPVNLETTHTVILFYNGLFIYFQSFKTNITILQQMNVKNVHPVSGAEI